MQFINSLLSLALLACLVISGLSFLAALMIGRIVAPGFQGTTYSITVLIDGCCCPPWCFRAAIAVVTGILQANKRFTLPALIGLPFNFILIYEAIIMGRKDILES